MKNAKMSKLFKNKKAINDISIIAILTFIFFMSAILIPYINAEFNVTDDVTYDTDGLASDIKDEGRSVGALSLYTVVVTIGKLAVYDFGNTLGLPFWLDAVYTVLAIIFILVIARNIWVGGGG